jgi:TolB protein
VTAVGAGTARVTATVQSVEGRATLRVEESDPGPGPEPGPVHSVTLDRIAVSLPEGETSALSATARDANGTLVTGRVVRWTSSNESVVRVGVFGELTGIKVGTARITARVDGASAVADVEVSADYDYDLLYDLSDEVGEAPELYRLAIRDAGATPVRVFPPGRKALHAAVSPDGTRIAFVVYVSGGSDLWVADLDGANALRIAGGNVMNDEPTWSPDGTRIAFRRWDLAATTGSDVWVVGADGSNPVNLTADQNQSSEGAPDWSPERTGGSRIVYSRTFNGQAHLWTMRPDGSDKTRITTGNVADMSPAWSPDGQRIAFERYGDQPGSYGDIWLVDGAGSGLFRLTNIPLGQFDPAWSPDGKMIAFSSGIASTLQIFTIWTDGTKLAQRTTGDRPHERPTWIRR